MWTVFFFFEMLIKKKKSPQKNGKIESYGPWPFEDIKFYALKRKKGNKKKKKHYCGF